jgi:hypothetical protein
MLTMHLDPRERTHAQYKHPEREGGARERESELRARERGSERAESERARELESERAREVR